MTDNEALNELDKNNNTQPMDENPFERQETSYEGYYLGCTKKAYKDKPEEFYGIVSMYYSGVRKSGDNAGKPWFSVQEQYMSVERMEKLTKDIPFMTKVVATYSCGNTPGGRQSISNLTPIE